MLHTERWRHRNIQGNIYRRVQWTYFKMNNYHIWPWTLRLFNRIISIVGGPPVRLYIKALALLLIHLLSWKLSVNKFYLNKLRNVIPCLRSFVKKNLTLVAYSNIFFKVKVNVMPSGHGHNSESEVVKQES